MIRRRLRRILGVVAPVAALVVVLVVLHGAGVPLTVPGVVVVLAVLLAGRLVVGLSRRRREPRWNRRP
ncbi:MULTISPECIES: hypothetical protein [Microbacterium]|jgi:hypothetical protein|uniref:hypothetical protein n=1 Tax=Microbacterium TaxID=33882 RepID=UPI001D17705E|nr:hypothetical protein [Microbacterium testaceum]MCC4248538.1 hypothetical protein [Microbacterium testaceum]